MGEDKDSGIERIKGKALKDDAEGWVTVKGNAGTVYAEVSSKHYSVMFEVPLHKKFPSEGSETVRELAKGEAIQALEPPKEETFSPAVRVKGRALSDGSVGWITVTKENVKPWTPFYKCAKATPIHNEMLVEGATVARELEVGEKVELLEGPKVEGKQIRIKARVEKDGTIGWMSIKDSDGKRSFAP